MNHFLILRRLANMITRRKGQSMVEMALVLPVLTVLTLGGIEYANLYILGLRASSLSREASNMALRDCRELEPDQMAICLQNIVDRIAPATNPILPDFYFAPGPDGTLSSAPKGTLRLSAWGVGTQEVIRGKNDNQIVGGCDSDETDQYGSPSMIASVFAGKDRASKIGTADTLYKFFSHIPANPDDSPTASEKDRLNSFLKEKGGYMFIAEVFYDYDPLVFNKTGLAELLPENGEIYQAGYF